MIYLFHSFMTVQKIKQRSFDLCAFYLQAIHANTYNSYEYLL